MFYIVSEGDEQILGTSVTCPDPDRQARFFGCSIYIIEGQHTGLSASLSKIDAMLCDFTPAELEEAACRANAPAS